MKRGKKLLEYNISTNYLIFYVATKIRIYKSQKGLKTFRYMTNTHANLHTP